ncbi:TlpA family protein disulfide reductase [Dyadobacter tibetensis]|uniref:TlpA family protein disulfide reductase n=1 Tax=Dyadobacter tibetensis TaxID=1211851 RepID=UPI000A00F8B2|nr:TlpA disulfide reductase family protein [Dyadobacter tibetensis]
MKKLALVLLILVLAGALYYAFTGDNNQVGSEEDQAVLQQNAPTGTYLTGLTDLEGNPVTMAEDKVVFLNIWATWCGPCNIEMPGIQALYNKYKDHEKVEFYIVSDEDAATVNPFIARKGYELPFYQFVGPYPAALDGNAIPRTYIIHNGQVLAQEVGAAQWDRPEVHQLIDQKLAEI